jgi:hypothetical protein
MRNFWLRGLFAATVALAIAFPTWSFIQERTPGNTPVRWDLLATQPNISGGRVLYLINKQGSDDLEFAALTTAVDSAFATWRMANGSIIDFLRVSDPSASPSGTRPTSFDQINAIFWEEDPRNTHAIEPDTFARVLRRVDGTTGRILDVDIVLNGFQFLWSAVADGNFSSVTGPLDVQETLTKAVGEFIGLNPVPTTGTVMQAIDFPGDTSRRTLGADDRAAALDLYTSGAAPPVTSISGRVARSGTGVFGAYVVAFQNGAPVVGAPTDTSGNYSIRRLPAGTYTVRAITLTPFPPGSFFATLDSNFLSEAFLNSATDPATAVVASEGSDTPGIDLEVQGATSPDPWEPNDILGDAKQIPTDGTRQIHHSHQTGDIDFVRFDAILGRFYLIETANLGSGGTFSFPTLSDTTLALTDPGGNPINQNNDRNSKQRNRASRIVFRASTTGSHIVRAAQFNSGTAGSGTAYDLSIIDLGATLPTPVVTSVLPQEGFTEGGIQVRVAGSNFIPGASVTFGGVPGTEVDVLSPTLLFATVPAASSPGPVNVVVTNPDGNPSAPLVGGFTYFEGITESFFNDTSGAFTNFPFTPGESDAVAWTDYDNDGDLDPFFTTSSAAQLGRNEIDFTFTQVSGSSGIVAETGGVINPESAAWGDYNNDGCMDVYKVNLVVAANKTLLRNNCDGTFTNVTAAAGVAGRSNGRSRDASWADYDNDGFLDLFVAYDDLLGPNQLFRNLGDGRFVDVAQSAGVDNVGRALNANWGDYNGDGFQDLYLVRSGTDTDILYRNDGDGSFTDATTLAGITDTAQGADAAWGDFNNDEFLDLYVVGLSGLNRLFLNDGDGTFTDVSTASGTNNTFGSARAVSLADFDNDGDLDIFVAQAFDGRQDSQIDFLFRNTGGGPPFFSDATFDAGVFDNLNGLAAAFGDYTADGVQDLMVGNAQTAGDILWFNAADRHDWLVVKLVGSASNRAGIGARVSVTADLDGNENTPPVTQSRQVFGGSKGQSPVQAVFGLGRTRPETKSVNELTVFWPSGLVSGPFLSLARNQVVTVFEAPPGILVSRVTPGSGPGAGGTTVVVSGENFDPDAVVRFGGTQASVVSRTGTNSITVTTPAHPAGLVDVSVTNPSRAVGDLLREATLRNGFLYFTGDPLTTLTIFDVMNTTLTWGSVVGAIGYDVIRGNLGSLQTVDGQVDLGSLVCIENESADTTTAPNHVDPNTPSPGQAFFYLFRVSGGTYGSSSAGLPRIPGPGTCP